ncbi:MAG: DUF1726 domain-containing protein, partial [Myxococcales bacterium]|nr:DUF1726 domain-containing protein [Myxococcales bacterium]
MGDREALAAARFPRASPRWYHTDVATPTDPDRHRRCLVLRGRPAETAAMALACVGDLSPAEVIWIGEAPAPFTSVAPAAVRRMLGRSCDAVVIDLHGGPDPDLLGQCQGFIRGGGALIVRRGEAPPAETPALAV